MDATWIVANSEGAEGIQLVTLKAHANTRLGPR